MEHLEIQGTSVPALGLGTWRLAGAECQESVEQALEIGYRHLDTAQMYGNESDVGAGIAAAGLPADELFITTKLSQGNLEADAVRRSAEQSAERLGVDRIDLLHIHHPSRTDIFEETLGAMQELREQGVVTHLGVSNFSIPQLERALEVAPLFAIQIEHHPFDGADDQVEAARRHDLLFQAYSPLARGAAADDDPLEEIADRLGVTAPQVALRWLLDQPNVAAIPKASSREHLEENWGALDVELDEEAQRRIGELAGRQLAASQVGD